MFSSLNSETRNALNRHSPSRGADGEKESSGLTSGSHHHLERLQHFQLGSFWFGRLYSLWLDKSFSNDSFHFKGSSSFNLRRKKNRINEINSENQLGLISVCQNTLQIGT